MKRTIPRTLRLLLLALLLPVAAFAAGTGTATFGDLVVNYFTNGKTEMKIVKGNQVLFYAVLSSAQTTTLRGVYTSTLSPASGGQTAGTYDAMDGTVTLPGDPIYGDLTD